ncbi:MAG TPA: alpha/beta hydrolase [Mucilaginibacter sp.]
MRYRPIIYLATILLLTAAACKSKTGASVADTTATAINAIKPKGPPPAWAPDMKPQMQTVIEKLQSFGDQSIETLGVGMARRNHTATDAVMGVMKDNHIPIPVYNVDTTGTDIAAAWGKVHLRIYTPKTGKGPFPVIVYYHGGGFVLAGINVYDASANILAEKVGAIVISVGYRLAPQYKFPYAHNDAFLAYQWALKNAAAIKGDSTKIAVAGESAGGNLAVATAMKARDFKIKLPVAVLAIYPVAGSNMKTPSYLKNETALPLNKPMMTWFLKKYLNNMAETKSPLIDLVSANLTGLPPTTIITAEIDPLQSEGIKLAEKLKADGVMVNSKNYDGVTHEFFGMGAVVPEAKDAEIYAVAQLKKVFGIK